jgi:hypothetical protein
MDKTLLKNSWVLAGLLLVVNIVLGLIMLLIFNFLKISSSLAGIAGIAGAMLVGQIYTANFKEIMPKKLRINATAIYTLAQIVLGSLYLFILGMSNNLSFFGILIVISLFYSLFIYWMLGSAGKTYLKALQKKEVTKNN